MTISLDGMMAPQGFFVNKFKGKQTTDLTREQAAKSDDVALSEMTTYESEVDQSLKELSEGLDTEELALESLFEVTLPLLELTMKQVHGEKGFEDLPGKDKNFLQKIGQRIADGFKTLLEMLGDLMRKIRVWYSKFFVPGQSRYYNDSKEKLHELFSANKGRKVLLFPKVQHRFDDFFQTLVGMSNDLKDHKEAIRTTIHDLEAGASIEEVHKENFETSAYAYGRDNFFNRNLDDSALDAGGNISNSQFIKRWIYGEKSVVDLELREIGTVFSLEDFNELDASRDKAIRLLYASTSEYSKVSKEVLDETEKFLQQHRFEDEDKAEYASIILDQVRSFKKAAVPMSQLALYAFNAYITHRRLLVRAMKKILSKE